MYRVYPWLLQFQSETFAGTGPDPNIPMIGVTLKHWIGNNVEGGVGHFSRMSIDANISAYDLVRSIGL